MTELSTIESQPVTTHKNRIAKYFHNNLVDGDEVIAEYDDNDALVAEYVMGDAIDEVLLMERDANGNGSFQSTERFCYLFDGLGSVTEITNKNGNIVENYDYDAYGNITGTKSIGNPYYFTGRRYDEESEIYHYRARAYDPVIGRFLQRDPLGYEVSMNLFEYANNSPTNFVDPYGDAPLFVIALAIAAASNAVFDAGIEVASQVIQNKISGCKEGLDGRKILKEGGKGAAIAGVFAGVGAAVNKVSKIQKIKKIIDSSRQLKGKTPRGAAKLQKRANDTAQFKNIKPSQEAAEKEIQKILNSNPRKVRDSKGRQIFKDPETGRAIRLNESGLFDTFLGP